MTTGKMNTVTYEKMLNEAPYFGTNEAIKYRLASLLTKLPERVREFVLGECIFTSSAEPLNAGIVHTAKVPERALYDPHDFWLIVISELMMVADLDKVKKEMKKSAEAGKEEMKRQNDSLNYILAHEIAHAYLGHGRLISTLGQDFEAEADKLATEWGFVTPGPYYTRKTR